MIYLDIFAGSTALERNRITTMQEGSWARCQACGWEGVVLDSGMCITCQKNALAEYDQESGTRHCSVAWSDGLFEAEVSK